MSRSNPSPTLRRRFAPPRIALLPVVVSLLGTLPAATAKAWLGPLLLLPLAAVVWVLRAHVRVSPLGLSVNNGLRDRHVPWERVAGFSTPARGPVRLLRVDQRPLPLTALSQRDLPALRRAAELDGRPQN